MERPLSHMVPRVGVLPDLSRVTRGQIAPARGRLELLSVLGTAVETSRLTRLHGRKRALDGLDMALPRGGIHAVVGANGAGKSTLFRLLLGFQKADSGDCFVLGRRAVFEPEAHAFGRPTPTNETEYTRKVRMFEHCWEITLRGSLLRRLPPGYLVSILSHRVLRYASGVLHVALLGSSVVLVGAGWPYALALAGQLAVLAAFAARVPLARYYVYVAWATVQALWNYLRRGVPATWDAAEGTR
jgi:hypothetical protein